MVTEKDALSQSRILEIYLQHPTLTRSFIFLSRPQAAETGTVVLRYIAEHGGDVAEGSSFPCSSALIASCRFSPHRLLTFSPDLSQPFNAFGWICSSTSELSKRDEVVKPFILGCDPKNQKAALISVTCIQKLVSQKAMPQVPPPLSLIGRICRDCVHLILCFSCLGCHLVCGGRGTWGHEGGHGHRL